MRNFIISYQNSNDLTPYPRNARTHSKKQIRQIADSIERFGFTNPILIDAGSRIIAGHGRVEAANLLGIEKVPSCPPADGQCPQAWWRHRIGGDGLQFAIGRRAG